MKEQYIKVSILITTYNLEKYIDETLHSVMEQEVNFPFEVLVGDDGSKDGTTHIINEWIRRYPNTIRLYIMDRDPNKEYNPISRASLNRINLFKHAKGEYVLFLDGDDIFCRRDKLARQVQILDDPMNKDCIMCGHNVDYWNPEINERIPMMSLDFVEQKITSQKYWGSLALVAESFLFRNIYHKDAFKSFNKEYFDDNLITFFFLKYGNIYYIPESMVCYRQHETPWKMKNTMEANIINAFDYSIEKQYNKKMICYSIKRHRIHFRYILKNATLLKDGLYEIYFAQAKKDKCDEVFTFMKNASGNIGQKMYARFIYLLMCIVDYKIFIYKSYDFLYWKCYAPIKNCIEKILKGTFYQKVK